MANNVGFLRGLQAALDAKTTGFQEGSFYLTTDTERLYYAKSTTKGGLVELNRSIRNIPGSDLPTTAQYSLKDGDIFYIEGLNALVIREGNGWTQLNPDTYLLNNTTAVTVATSGSGAEISMSVSDTKNGSNAEHTASGNVLLKPGNNVTITANSSTREITIGSSFTNSTYDLKTAAGSTANEAVLKLVGTNPASTATVKIKADGQMVTVSGDANGNIAISGVKPISALSSNVNASGTFGISATLNNGDTVSTSSVTPRIVYGEGGSSSAVFASGTATLDVYTKSQVDSLVSDVLRSADALVFKGVVSTQSAVNALTAPKAGDTYKIGGTSTLTVKDENGNNINAEPGDLITAVEKQSPATGTYWIVVPSGNEPVVTVSDFNDSSNNAITIGKQYPGDSSSSVLGSLTINGATSVTNSNNLIVVTPTVSGSSKTLTISHGKPAANSGSALTFATGTSQSASATKEIKVITSISFDSAGHMTTATAEKFNVVDTHGAFSFGAVNMGVTATANGTVGSYGLTTTFDGVSTTRTLALRSSSLAIGVANGADACLDVNLEWGSF